MTTFLAIAAILGWGCALAVGLAGLFAAMEMRLDREETDFWRGQYQQLLEITARGVEITNRLRREAASERDDGDDWPDRDEIYRRQCAKERGEVM